MGFQRTCQWIGLVTIAALTGMSSGEAEASPSNHHSYEGHRLVRVQVRSVAELEAITASGADIWTEVPAVGPIDVLVSPQELAWLDVTSIPYIVLADDVAAQVEAERNRLAVQVPPQTLDAWFDDFKDYATVDAQLDVLAAENPAIAEVLDVGSSVEGRDIRGLRITGTGTEKDAFVIHGCQHAREWISVMVPMCFADTLIRDYETDPMIAELVDGVEWLIVPIVNPDGYDYTWTDERFWRKNRQGGYGVDLNRNWGYEWGGPGASPNQNDGNYHGAAPFSEPETQAIRDLILDHPNVGIHIDYHSFQTQILYPWTHTFVPPPDQEALQYYGQEMYDQIFATHGEDYEVLQGFELYVHSGTSIDWTYGSLGKPAYTIELRPGDSFQDVGLQGFVLPPEQIVPTCEEQMAAMFHIAGLMLHPSGGDETGTTTGTGTGTSGEGSTTGDEDSGEVTTEGDATATTQTTTGPDETSGTSDTGEGDGGSSDSNGCGCTSGPQTAPWAALLALGWVRRRRSATL